jgi:COP9 signalosome complex subunit 4
MASPEIESALQEIETSAAANKASSYNKLLSKIVSNSSSNSLPENLIAYVRSIVGESISLVASRPLLNAFVDKFGTLQNAELKIGVGNQVLEIIAPKVVSYEEQDTKIKEILAGAYEEEEDYRGSAKILQSITLDSSQRNVSPDEKAKVWIRIVRCYLEEGDPVSAMSYLNRVKTVFHSVTDRETKLYFALSQARIYDSQRSFLDAASAYHNVSFQTDIDEEERLRALGEAVKCAVLAPAGPNRSKTLAKLYKDERASQIDEFGILEKIFLDRLLTSSEVSAFAAKLQDHQKAQTADGSTVLEKAILEHNLLGASRLYSNIGFDQLGELLGVDADKAERYAAQMIEQGRLAGYIDQIDRFIFFQGEGSGKRKKGHAEKVVGAELRKWDANVQALAEEVEKTTTMIQNQYPVRCLNLCLTLH